MQIELSPGERALQQKAREIARDAIAPRAAEIDRTEAYPWDHVKTLNDAGLMGLTIPKDLGDHSMPMVSKR